MVVGEPQILGQVKEAYATAARRWRLRRSSISCSRALLRFPNAFELKLRWDSLLRVNRVGSRRTGKENLWKPE